MLDLQNATVRDLAWVITSPCIIKHPLALEYDTEKELETFSKILQELDAKPAELEEFIAKKKRKALGSYFESLVEFWLTKREDINILAQNLQIIDGKKTIGECDFLAEVGGVVTHIEVAIKYYLAIENSSNHKAWVGRGGGDRLDIKLDKMFNHQLQLSDSKPMQEALKDRGIGEVENKTAIFKGYFFQHFFNKKHLLPSNCTPNIDASYWCTISELNNLPDEYDEWQILHKPHWMTYVEGWTDRDQLKNNVEEYYVEIKNTPVLCNARNSGSGEITKFFIASNSWLPSLPSAP